MLNCVVILSSFFFLILNVSDAKNVAIQITQHRIISLAPHLTELIYEMKQQHQLVGTVERSDFPIAAKNIPIIGNVYGLNVQKIHQLKPTLALAWQGTPAKHIELLKQLKIPVFVDNSLRLSDINPTRIQLGKLLNVALINAIPQLKIPQKFTKPIKATKNLKIWYELWSEPLMTLGKKHWIHDIIKECGFETVATPDVVGSVRRSFLSLKQEKIQPNLIITHQKNRISFWKNNGYDVLFIDENHLTIPSSRLQYGINQLCGL